jgi:hypothetical protein
MPGSVLPILAEYFMSKYSLCCFVLQHSPLTPAKTRVIPCSGESRAVLHLLGFLVSSSVSFSFWNTFAPSTLYFQGIFLYCRARKIKSFPLRHLVSCSNTTCVEQAKLQLSSLLAIVGFIPNLILFLILQKG